MGCDIHGWIEAKVDGKWIAVREMKDDTRNYERFAALAGVRGYGPKPKGVPEDVSETAAFHIREWGNDAHSHSWASVPDAAAIFLKTDFLPDDGYRSKYPMEAYFGVDGERDSVPPELHRLVFWFDN